MSLRAQYLTDVLISDVLVSVKSLLCMKKLPGKQHDYLRKIIWFSSFQLDGNLASDVSTRCSGRPQGMKTNYEIR